MTYKRFRQAKVVLSAILATIMAQAVIFYNYYLAIAAVLASVAISMLLRRSVKEITTDERDYEVVGRAARYSITVHAVVTSAAAAVFLFMRNIDPVYEIIGSVLAYSSCALLILMSTFYTILRNKPNL